MAFPKRQNLFDWSTQLWNIVLGRRVVAGEDDWLVGPIGQIGSSAREFVQRIASENDLEIRTDAPGAGLLPGFEDWGFEINRKVAEFYHQTGSYKFLVRSLWEPNFGFAGELITILFSRRIEQFNLPNARSGEEIAFKSELFQLINREGKVVYTVWLRSIADTGEMVFYGVYSICQLPSGALGVRSVFPLPQGNATVVFNITGDASGDLDLVSVGKGYSEAGFYFIVEDLKGQCWKHYLPSLRQWIRVFEDEHSGLRAEHLMMLWSFPVYRMLYTIQKPEPQVAV